MESYIIKSDVNILGGRFNVSIPFTRGLNIISGENGTCKTKLLQEIKDGHFIPSDPTKPPIRIQAVSPKRNSERRAVESILQTMRSQNKNYDTYITERGGVRINDNTFDNYPVTLP